MTEMLASSDLPDSTKAAAAATEKTED